MMPCGNWSLMSYLTGSQNFHFVSSSLQASFLALVFCQTSFPAASGNLSPRQDLFTRLVLQNWAPPSLAAFLLISFVPFRCCPSLHCMVKPLIYLSIFSLVAASTHLEPPLLYDYMWLWSMAYLFTDILCPPPPTFKGPIKSYKANRVTWNHSADTSWW